MLGLLLRHTPTDTYVPPIPSVLTAVPLLLLLLQAKKSYEKEKAAYEAKKK